MNDPSNYALGSLWAAEDDTYTVADILRDIDTYFCVHGTKRRAKIRRCRKNRLRAIAKLKPHTKSV